MICIKTLVQNPYYQVESLELTPYNRLADWMQDLKIMPNSLTACEKVV